MPNYVLSYLVTNKCYRHQLLYGLCLIFPFKYSHATTECHFDIYSNLVKIKTPKVCYISATTLGALYQIEFSFSRNLH